MYSYGNRFEVVINGGPAYEYPHEGKTFVEGRRGHEYALKFTNQSYQRKKIVVSVDGLNVMTGDSTWARGYVVEPHGSILIPGWRKDNNNTAAFEFSTVDGSYNEHNLEGDVRNVGVIGCKVFNEVVTYVQPDVVWVDPPKHYPYWEWGPNQMQTTYLADASPRSVNNLQISASATAYNAAVAPEVKSAGFVSQEVGTAWGRNKEFKTQVAYNKFNEYTSDVLVLYYDSKKGLIRRGVDFGKYMVYNNLPNPFPDGCPSPIRK